jgi:3-hydroxyisobutyrate dehydrogenase-like beta-hydroxyacid dehydrogenase
VGPAGRTIAVLGLGEAGGRIAADLVARGVDVRGFDPDPARDVHGITRAGDPAEAAEGSDAVLSANAAEVALEAARSALPGLERGAVYADLNTASPESKRELAALVGPAHALFADVALLGPIPLEGLAAPVLASGDGAPRFASIFGPLGMPVTVISDRAGDAAALKLVRSVFMKGLAASVVESMQAAEAAGHRDWLAQEIEAVIGAWRLERALDGSGRHALRRRAEMEAACDLLRELGVEPHVAAASAAQLAELLTTQEHEPAR